MRLVNEGPFAEVQMEVRGLILDPVSKVPVVILRDPKNAVLLPIWIGPFEANAIVARLEGVEPARPMTHDLAASLLAALDATLDKVVICDLRESTFFAVLHLTPRVVPNDPPKEQTAKPGARSAIVVDARPSDAIALALRLNAPVFVLAEVLDRARLGETAALDGADANDSENLKKVLAELRPEDLGKYKM
jgi:bifunctional DNase/RNase